MNRLLLIVVGAALAGVVWFVLQFASEVDAAPTTIELPTDPAPVRTTPRRKQAAVLDPGPPQESDSPDSGAAPLDAGTADDPSGVVNEGEPETPVGATAEAYSWLRKLSPDKFGALSDVELANLTELDLQGLSISDADLDHLVALPQVQGLNLRGTAVTDQGLAKLWPLGRLSSLDLRGTAVSGQGLAGLSANGLTSLSLTDTQVQGAELSSLPSMPGLQQIKLNRIPMDDTALTSLAAYPALKHVEFDGTSVTAQGLTSLLVQNPAITRIEARSCGLKSEDIATLRTAHPDCEFVFE